MKLGQTFNIIWLNFERSLTEGGTHWNEIEVNSKQKETKVGTLTKQYWSEL